MIEAGRLGDEDLRGIHRLDSRIVFRNFCGLEITFKPEDVSLVLIVLPHSLESKASEAG